MTDRNLFCKINMSMLSKSVNRPKYWVPKFKCSNKVLYRHPVQSWGNDVMDCSWYVLSLLSGHKTLWQIFRDFIAYFFYFLI